MDAEDGALGAEDGASDVEDGASDTENGALDSEGSALDLEDDDWGSQDAALGWGGVALPWLVQEDEFEWVNIRSGRRGRNKEKSRITNFAQSPGPADRTGRGRKKNKRKADMFL